MNLRSISGQRSRRVLLVGGTGLISTAITTRLLARGDEVWVFNRGCTPNRAGDVNRITGDRQNVPEFVARVREHGPFDAIIDMICFNAADAAALAEAAAGTAPHVILCSTVDVYHKSGDHAPLDENAPLKGFSDYARHKIAAESTLLAAGPHRGFGVSIARPAYTYGEGGGILHTFGWGTDFLDRLRRQKPVIVSGDGTQLWTATHCEDVAAGFLGLLDQPGSGRAYNLTGDECLSWNRYHELLAEAIGAPSPRLVHIPAGILAAATPRRGALNQVNLQYSNVFDSSAARRDLNFKPRIGFRDGMGRTFRWLVEQGRITDADLDPGYDELVAAWSRANKTFIADASRTDLPP